MTFLKTALDLASRGFHVFPLKPRDKWPIVAGGFKAATRDPDYIRLWWSKTPEANIGIACGSSNLCVMDCDHGLTSREDFEQWRMRNNIPVTYCVRSGRRPEFGVQMYFRGAVPNGGSKFELDGVRGEIKSTGGLVVAPPSIHPDTYETYAVLVDTPLANTPEFVKQLKKPAEIQSASGGLDTETRNLDMCSFIGTIRKSTSGLDVETCLAICEHRNQQYTKGPLPGDELEELVRKQYRLYPHVAPDPVAIIGKPQKKTITDWWRRYHSFAEMSNAPEPTFIIEGFLQKDVITAIAAPVGQRKTIIAANVVHASITGEPLFDHFMVIGKPERVLYLCPEMGLYSFAKRIRNLGLMEYVGKTLFCRTMNSEGRLLLADLTDEELAGALVVIDTAVRFVEGDENSAEDMKFFAEDCFRLMKAGAASVLVLFHSPKETKNASDLTLENAMRGSGDLGAFVSSAWATRLQEPDLPWESVSYLKNVKQRDFESDPFTVKSDKLGRLHIVDKPGCNVKLASKPVGLPGDKDGKEASALQIIRGNLGLSNAKLSQKLKANGIERSPTWVGNKRNEITGTGVRTGAA